MNNTLLERLDAGGYDSEEYDDGYDDDYDPYYTEYGCDFPDHCLMPSLHFRYECYTKEMAEEWAEKTARDS